MAAFFVKNMGTILVGLLLAGIVAAIVINLVRDKRKGKIISCNSGCTSCPKAGACHVAMQQPKPVVRRAKFARATAPPPERLVKIKGEPAKP